MHYPQSLAKNGGKLEMNELVPGVRKGGEFSKNRIIWYMKLKDTVQIFQRCETCYFSSYLGSSFKSFMNFTDSTDLKDINIDLDH